MGSNSFAAAAFEVVWRVRGGVLRVWMRARSLAAMTHFVVTHEPGKQTSLPIFSAPAVPETPTETKLEIVRDGVFVIHGVASKEECDAIVATSEAMGYTDDAPVSLGRSIRKNQSCVWIFDPEQNDRFFDRAKPHLPGDPVGLNRRWRLYKYEKDDTFKMHHDGAWPGSGIQDGKLVQDIYDGKAVSWLTFLLYLNDDFTGGSTSFQGFSVTPKRGSALCFLHGFHPRSFLHQGDIVTDGVKYVARSDVLYQVPDDDS